MKVLHISTGYPLSYAGGITNYVRMLAIEQFNNKIDVSVLGSIDNKKDFKFKYYEYESKKIKPFTLGKSEDKEALRKIKDILEKEKFDLIHIHMMLDIDWNIVDILKGKYKYIISLHDYFYICPRIILMDGSGQICREYDNEKCSKCVTKFETIDLVRRIGNRVSSKINFKYPCVEQKYTKQRYYKFKELLEGAELLLPVSNRVKELYESAGINGKYKVLHIGNYSAENYKKFNKEDYKTKESIDIVMLGALTYHKGAEVLLKLIEGVKNPNIKFHFYGRTEQKYEEKLIKSGLICHGKYNPSELGEILKKMDLGCVLSIWEDNAPQVVMELLNNNVPVIGTKMGGIIDFVNESNGYIFDPYNDEEVKSVIRFLNDIDIQKIIELKNNIRRTKTPNEHLNEINDTYVKILGE